MEIPIYQTHVCGSNRPCLTRIIYQSEHQSSSNDDKASIQIMCNYDHICIWIGLKDDNIDENVFQPFADSLYESIKSFFHDPNYVLFELIKHMEIPDSVEAISLDIFHPSFCEKDNVFEKTSVHIESWLNNPSYDSKFESGKIIIPDTTISCKFTYPLSNEFIQTFINENGFTFHDIIQNICQTYKYIYEEEEKSLTPTDYPLNHPTLKYNRKETNGPFGISSHFLNDLYIEEITYDTDTKMIHMFIGS